jgi:hypothetical protein
MRRVPDAALRRHYRRRLWRVLARRPNPRLLRMYCVYCAIHFHYGRLIRQMVADRAGIAGPLPSLAAPAGEAAARAGAG